MDGRTDIELGAGEGCTLVKLQREVERLLPGARLEFQEGRAAIYVPKELARTLSRRIRRIRKLGDKYGVEVRIIVENP